MSSRRAARLRADESPILGDELISEKLEKKDSLFIRYLNTNGLYVDPI